MKFSTYASTLLLAGTIALLLQSCGPGTTSGKPRSTGTTSEILIVTNTKDTWNGPVGDTIRKWFSQPIPGLSQPEQMFDMLNVASKDFNDLFKKYHNILIVDINPETGQEPSSQSMEDIWSQPQQVITVSAADEKGFFREFSGNKANYLELFNSLERKRIEVLNSMSGDIALQKKVTDKFKLFLDFPGGFYMGSEAPGFMWIRHKVVKGKQDVELGIMIYTTDYIDTAQVSPKYILNWRNIITRQHIPGPSEGSYMVTSTDFVKPVVSYQEDFPVGFAVQIN